MGVIDKVQVGGTTYDVQDSLARESVAQVISNVPIIENVTVSSYAKRIIAQNGSISASNASARMWQISASGIIKVIITSARKSSWSTAGPLIAFYNTGNWDNLGPSTLIMAGTQHTDGSTYTEEYIVPPGTASFCIQSCDDYGDPTLIRYRGRADENLAGVENATAKASHTTGSLLMLGGKLYTATSPIAAGESITPGTNVSTTNVATQLAARDTAIAAEASDRTTEDNSLDQRVNVLHGLVDYGYSTPYYGSGGAATRNRTLFTVNNSWNSSSNPVAFRLNGIIKSATTNTGIDEYTNPLKLTVGHTYSWQMTPISGTVTTGSWVPAVYTSGGHETAAGAYTYPDGTKHLDFTYTQEMDTAGGVQLCFRAIRTSGITFTNFCVQCVLVDTTPGQRNLPFAPTTDGTYTLKVTVSSGVPTYSWVADT